MYSVVRAVDFLLFVMAFNQCSIKLSTQKSQFLTAS